VRLQKGYHNLQNWSGKETTSIVYDDTEGLFTQLLVNQGYISRPWWVSKRPKYYIDVKATTRFWTSPFSVTQDQIDLMEGEVNAVYLLMRVFNLGRAGMGFKLYLDPADMRRKGGLIFRSDQYEVLPGFVFDT
jgi:hypothetical protein